MQNLKYSYTVCSYRKKIIKLPGNIIKICSWMFSFLECIYLKSIFQEKSTKFHIKNKPKKECQTIISSSQVLGFLCDIYYAPLHWFNCHHKYHCFENMFFLLIAILIWQHKKLITYSRFEKKVVHVSHKRVRLYQLHSDIDCTIDWTIITRALFC